MSKVCIVLFAVVACALAQDNETFPDPAAEQPPIAGDVSGALGAVAAQQMAMNGMATVILEWQSANAWATFTQLLSRQAALISDEDGDGIAELEEEVETPHKTRDLEVDMSSYNQFAGGMATGGFAAGAYSDDDNIELQAEYALAFALKIMWLEAAKKLEGAQQMHYQNKVQIAVLQSAGAGNPTLSYALMLMYYRTVLETLGSMTSIARQDAWTHWNYQEIIETIEFEKGNVPDTFDDSMARLKASAMNTWQMEASIDIQSLFIDFYLSYLAGAGSSMPGSSVPGSSVPPAAASFLEEEAEPAEPAKPSINPQAMSYYWMMTLYYMKLYVRFTNYYAAQAWSTLSHLELDDAVEESSEDQIEYLQKTGIMYWSQWAHLKQLLAYYNLFFLWYGTGGFGSMGSMGSMGGGSGSIPGAMLGGSLGGPYGSLLGGSLGGSMGNLFQEQQATMPSIQNE